MSGQSRKGSATEAVFNVLVGYWVAVLANHLLFPLVLGLAINVQANMVLAGFFTVVSFVRNYVLRRFFNWVTVRQQATGRI